MNCLRATRIVYSNIYYCYFLTPIIWLIGVGLTIRVHGSCFMYNSITANSSMTHLINHVIRINSNTICLIYKLHDTIYLFNKEVVSCEISNVSEKTSIICMGYTLFFLFNTWVILIHSLFSF